MKEQNNRFNWGAGGGGLSHPTPSHTFWAKIKKKKKEETTILPS